VGVETSAVQIRIDVVDANSGAAIAAVEQNVKKLGTTAVASSQQMKQGLEAAGGMALSAREKTRLLTEEFGIRIPRAMQTLVAQSKLAQAALGSLTGAMVAFGAVQIGGMVFEAAYRGAEKLWDHFQGLTKAAQDYQTEIEKTQQQEFGNARSIETTRLRIDDATDSAKDFMRQAEDARKVTVGWRDALSLVVPGAGGLWQAWHSQGQANDLAAQSVAAQRQRDRLAQLTEGSQYHEQRVGNINLQHAGDSALKGQQKITAEYQKRRDLAAETRRYENEQDRIHGNPVASNSGASKEALADSTALAEARAQQTVLARQQAQELMHLREQALEAGLKGEALYKAQEAAAIEELKFKDMDSMVARSAIHARYHAEELKRIQDETRETERLERAAALSGMTGIGRTQMEGANRIADINADTSLDPENRARRVAAAQRETDQQISEEQRTFAEQVDSIVEQSADKQVGGFARIRAEASKAAADLQRQFDKAHELMNLSAPGAQDVLDRDTAQLSRGLGAINSGADSQTEQLARKNSEDTERIEAEARIKLLDSEKQKTAAIQVELNERLQKYREELQQQEISEDDFNRRSVAAQQQAQAEMIQAATEAREKMAGEFDSLFKSLDHPMQALKSLGEKAAAEAAASLVQRLQQRSQGSAGASGDNGMPRGLLSDVLGGFGFGGRKNAAPGASPVPGSSEPPHATDKSLSVAHATIQVGSASFSFGSGGGAGTAAPGASPGGGSTGLFASGTSGASGGFVSGAPSSSGGGGEMYGGSSYGSGDVVGGYSGGTGGAAAGGGATPATFGTAGTYNPQQGNRAGGVISNLQQGWNFFNQAKRTFGGGSGSGAGSDNGLAETQGSPLAGTLNADGSFTSAGSTNGGMLGGGGFKGNIGGAISGGLGVYSAVEGNGGVGGALGGAMSGMQLGMALGGPIGAAIGAAAGAVVGAIGFGGREKARVYDLKNVRPRITSDQDSYNQGTMAYSDVYQDFQGLQTSSWAAIRSLGPSAMGYWNDTIKPEIQQAQAKLTAEQRAGRSMYTSQGAQYATGADYVPRTENALVHRGERIFDTDQNERITRAITGDGARMPAQGQSMGDVHLHVHAIDAKGVEAFLGKYKHNIRSAVNDSYAENSGGGL
jgi:hypothetical protein